MKGKQAYTLTESVRGFEKGQMVWRYIGPTYGLVEDDWRYGRLETIPCTTDGETFFTVEKRHLLEAMRDE